MQVLVKGLRASMRAVVLLSILLAGIAPAHAAKPMAVWFYADWCMNCKQIAPKLAQVQPAYEDRIDFIKLDVTNAERKVETRDKAKELGILKLYLANRGTGWLALLDADRQQVGELRHFMSIEEMQAALDRLVAATPAVP